MSTPAISRARQLVEVVDELMAFAANFYPQPLPQGVRYLSKEEKELLFSLEGRVVALHSAVAGGRIPFEGRPANCREPSRYTLLTGLPHTLPRMTLLPSAEWEAKMLSLRAAARAVAETEEAGQRKDTKKDSKKKGKPSRPRNLQELKAIQRKVDKFRRRGERQEDAVREHVEENYHDLQTEQQIQAKVDTLIRSLNRYKELLK